MTVHIAENIADLTNSFELINQEFSQRPWWRGHRDASWLLLPSLYRERRSEIGLTGRFRLTAKARYDKCPEPDDLFGWLFLMQHYRLPTRLLDWSESPLTALYFALVDSSANDKDAVLWALRPGELNLQQLGDANLLTPENEATRKITRDAFNSAKTSDKTLAVMPMISDLRHMVQQSRVTIHGNNEPLDQMPGEKGFLSSIRIPADSKIRFRGILSLYGISRAELFPDLENLAKDIKSMTFTSP